MTQTKKRYNKKISHYFAAARVASNVKNQTTPIYDEVLRSFKMSHNEQAIQENKDQEAEEIIKGIKEKVVSLLITKHDFDDDEAQEKVDESVKSDPEMWGVNSDSEELADLLADGDDED